MQVLDMSIPFILTCQCRQISTYNRLKSKSEYSPLVLVGALYWHDLIMTLWLFFPLKVFVEWNKGELDSFLIEITKDILAFKDSDGVPLVEKIRDSAGQVRRIFYFFVITIKDIHWVLKDFEIRLFSNIVSALCNRMV